MKRAVAYPTKLALILGLLAWSVGACAQFGGALDLIRGWHRPGSTTSFAYEAPTNVVSVADFLGQSIAEGAKGYLFIGDYAFGSDHSDLRSIYVRANSHASTFNYLALPNMTSAADFLSQANAEGAKGYLFIGDYAFGNGYSDLRSIYVKDNSQASTFGYQALTNVVSAAEFFSQANAEGSKGYLFIGDYAFGNGYSDLRSIYVKDNSQASTFVYQTLTNVVSAAEFLSQANAEGSKGYLFIGDYAFGTGYLDLRSIYVKDNSQASTFSYQALTNVASVTEFLSQANAEGVKGYLFIGDYAFGAGSSDLRSIYVGAGGASNPSPGGLGTTVATEFYHPQFDHYFITSVAAEAQSLAAGNLLPWAPTGRSFKVWTSSSANITNVCRFFSASFAPKSGHFYSNNPAECPGLQAGGVWVLEDSVAFYMMPSPDGNCPGGTIPLYRLYNDGQGGAPNHRYTIDLAVRSSMIAAHWIPEGSGPNGVFACVPV